MNDFFYKKGYKEGYQTGYQQGYQAAINDVLKRLSKYETKMEAIEAGKYLMQTGQITYPQVYKESTSNGYKIVIIPPKVEDTLSLNSLITLPFIDNICNNDSKIDNNTNNETKQSFFVNNQNNIIKTGITPVENQNKETVLNFPKTQKIFNILQNSGVPFVENANSYTVYFQDINQEKSFCKNIGGKICNLAQ